MVAVRGVEYIQRVGADDAALVAQTHELSPHLQRPVRVQRAQYHTFGVELYHLLGPVYPLANGEVVQKAQKFILNAQKPLDSSAGHPGAENHYCFHCKHPQVVL